MHIGRDHRQAHRTTKSLLTMRTHQVQSTLVQIVDRGFHGRLLTTNPRKARVRFSVLVYLTSATFLRHDHQFQILRQGIAVQFRGIPRIHTARSQRRITHLGLPYKIHDHGRIRPLVEHLVAINVLMLILQYAHGQPQPRQHPALPLLIQRVCSS